MAACLVWDWLRFCSGISPSLVSRPLYNLPLLAVQKSRGSLAACMNVTQVTNLKRQYIFCILFQPATHWTHGVYECWVPASYVDICSTLPGISLFLPFWAITHAPFYILSIHMSFTWIYIPLHTFPYQCGKKLSWEWDLDLVSERNLETLLTW